MKAVMIHKSGPPDVIVVDEVPGPTRTRRGVGPLLTLRVPGAARRDLARLESGKARYPHKLDKGGHFAAWEQPKLFTREIRAAFRSLR